MYPRKHCSFQVCNFKSVHKGDYNKGYKNNKVKVKFTLDQATKAQRGSRCIALLFLQPRRYMGVADQRHAPVALPPGKVRYPLYRRLGGPQGQSGRVWKISPPTGIRSPDRPACSESLYRLSYPGPRYIIIIIIRGN